MANDSERQCCILGGCGFLGSVVAGQLVRAGWRVRILDREGVDPWRLASFQGSVELLRGDFMNAGDLRSALEGVSVVLHFVGTTIPQSSMKDIAYDIQTNVISTVRLLELMRIMGIPRLIYASSGGTVYGPARTDHPMKEDHPTDPISAYGISKLMAEKYIRLFAADEGLRPVILRFANPYGENQDPRRPQGAVSVFLDRVLSGEEILIWGDGSVVRDYLYQEDLGAAVFAIAENSAIQGTFNVGSGTGHSLTEILGAIETVMDRQGIVRFLPERTFDVPYNVLDSSHLERATTWQAQTILLDGITKMVKARGSQVPYYGLNIKS